MSQGIAANVQALAKLVTDDSHPDIEEQNKRLAGQRERLRPFLAEIDGHERAGHRSDQGIVHAEMPEVTEIEDGDVGVLARSLLPFNSRERNESSAAAAIRTCTSFGLAR